jgi:hypothetical protein
MSTMVEQPPVTPSTASPAGSLGRLVRAELHRFRARRFIQALLALGVLGWLAATVIGLTQFGVPNDQDYADAQQRIEQEVAISNGFRQDCLNDPNRPADVPADEPCGPEMTASDFRVEDWLDKSPFDLASAGQPGAIGFGAAAAVLAFLIGATWIGAEWSSRSLVALLFWETRRVRVFGAKIAVLLGAAALLGVVMQAGWLAMASILRAAVGNGADLPDRFWGDLLAMQGRCVLLTVLAALAGFGLANLVRNTGAALGVGFVYFAVVETAVRALRPGWVPYLVTSNVGALLSRGGFDIPIFDGSFTVDGQPRIVHVSSLQGGLVLAVVLALVVGVGVVLFARRDVQ